MAKISIILPDKLDSKIRQYAEENDTNITNTCIILLKKGLDFTEKDNINLEKYEQLEKDYKDLEKELAETKKKYERERTERIKTLENYKNFNNKLLELMQADKILQIEQKQPKKNLLNRIKIFFIGEKPEK